jgi:hypothetical protein
MRWSAEYRTWCNMKSRCGDTRAADKKNYAERGILVCARWERSFEAFFEDMGPRPSPRHTIERKDNDRGYEPSNCVWATRYEQNSNTRRNRILTLGGETMTLSQWARRVGCSRSLLEARIGRLGWTLERAFAVKPGDGHKAAPARHRTFDGKFAR